jgi:hypothetical protein
MEIPVVGSSLVVRAHTATSNIAEATTDVVTP